ncbi:11464_t:CDS:2 [Paraglomus brasilianum]|uniref:11464_t:CDS:1 n=1 Tax=Paraglomus brasilianum TaxID=144538 RepID=A0A9N9GNK4_9GLOM|nr:11464_t:CDS:2 [Paraglomus brasilianum]
MTGVTGWIYLDKKDKSSPSSPLSNIYTWQMMVKNLTFDDVAKRWKVERKIAVLQVDDEIRTFYQLY